MQHLDRLSSAAQSLLWLFLPFLSSQFCGIYRVREEVWELRLGWNTECHMQKCPRDPKGFLMQALEQLPQLIRNLRQWPGLSNPSDFCRADSPVPIAQRRYRTSSREAERPKKKFYWIPRSGNSEPTLQNHSMVFWKEKRNQTLLFLSMSSINAKGRGEGIPEVAQPHEVALGKGDVIPTWEFFNMTLNIMLKVFSKGFTINQTPLASMRSTASLLFTFDFLHPSSPGFIVGLQSSGSLKLCSANLSL